MLINIITLKLYIVHRSYKRYTMYRPNDDKKNMIALDNLHRNVQGRGQLPN